VGASAAPPPEPPAPQIPPFPPKVKAACVGRHAEEMVAGQKITRGQWEKEVDKMVRWGAQVKPEDREALIDFLASRAPPIAALRAMEFARTSQDLSAFVECGGPVQHHSDRQRVGHRFIAAKLR
jgi:hypothetical protein